ncbi:hypothetical protein PO883_15025 [Massilia sp. DJPM01]|uniref:hypothetical protein n=1 Tax=Massilia sp. DJPM01 TaxID=3024404 RepID=UPI00259D39C9|nr:hypothetical protein [Massilia sp. DJPM01]MDM5178509.1 hypothetical protein [Massilia sp. DJPM01]
MNKTDTVKLTSAIGIQGQLIRAGEIITLPKAAALDLLRRGKAVVATEHDEPTVDVLEDESAVGGAEEPGEVTEPAHNDAIAPGVLAPVKTTKAKK